MTKGELSLALSNGNICKIKQLLENGEDIKEIFNNLNEIQERFVTLNNNTRFYMFKYLIEEYKISVEYITRILIVATENSEMDVIQFILENNYVDVNKAFCHDDKDISALSNACLWGKDYKVIKYLLTKGGARPTNIVTIYGCVRK